MQESPRFYAVVHGFSMHANMGESRPPRVGGVITRRTMKAYMCVVCGFVYEEENGWPQEGIPPGTRWEDVPENWKCPECGAAKSDFEMVEI